MSTTFERIVPASLEWRDGLPYSSEFDDVYFSKANGLEEKSHVFLEGNRLAQRWPQLGNLTSPRFVIGELGFGIGLNFLLTCRLWCQSAPAQAKLVYYSCEHHPLSREDLKRSLALWPKLYELSAVLIEQYPVLTPGFHCLTFDNGRITLVLMLGEASACYRELLCCGEPVLEKQLNPHQFDAWYLDGFAPARNQTMWTDTLLATLAMLSKPGATFATYSAAAMVRESLSNNGFNYQKIPGYGCKRHMLVGEFCAGTAGKAKPESPWHVAQPLQYKQKTALIIGAGIAGCLSANALARRGWQVRILDANSNCAEGASAVEQAVLFPNLSLYQSPLTRFMLQAFLYAYSYYSPLLSKGVSGQLCGMLQLESTQKTADALTALNEWLQYYPELAVLLSAEQASKVAGVTLNRQGLFVPRSGWISMASLCNFLLAHENIHCEFNTPVTTLNFRDNQWHTEKHHASVAILCGGFQTAGFQQAAFLPIKSIGGQLSRLRSHLSLNELQTPICADGHVLPDQGEGHLFGATYRLGNACSELSEQDTQRNLKKLASIFPNLRVSSQDVTTEWVGVRAAIPDYLPIVGELPNPQEFINTYKPLAANRKRFINKASPTHPGLYVCCGFGSRALTTAPLATEWLAALINNEPFCISNSMAQSLSPARFLFKDLIRQKY